MQTQEDKTSGYERVMLEPKGQPSPVVDEITPLNAHEARSHWHLPGTVVSLFLLAVLCATGHLLFFQYLDGRRLGIDTDVPQTWIAPISFIFGLAFRGALCACLSVAFAQHIWRVIMASVLSVRVIDRLYSLQRNVFSMFHLDNIRASPALFLLVSLYWLIPLATVFPSGALVVEGGLHPSFDEQLKVPIFDPAFLGNGTLNETIKWSLAPDMDLYKQSILGGPVERPNLISSSAAISLASERTYTISSPCGSNCTYDIEFDGPYFQCDATTKNETKSYRVMRTGVREAANFVTFTGEWDGSDSGWARINMTSDEDGSTPIVDKPATFTFTTKEPLVWQMKPENMKDFNDTFYVQNLTELTCTPARAKYKVNVNYTSGEAAYDVKTEVIDTLDDFWYPGKLNISSYDYVFNDTTKEAIANLRATNLWILMDSLVGTLAGSVTCITMSNNTLETFNNVKGPDGQTYESIEGEAWYCYQHEPTNGTIIHNTPFNTRRFALGTESPEFHITQDNLNAALINITLSAMNRLNQYSTQTNSTRLTWATSYRFEEPVRLIAPYFLALALAVPFLLLGFISLVRNGAPAPTDRVVDLLVLGATSEGVRDAAKDIQFEKGRGYGKGTKQLGKLKLKYGEFVHGSDDVRR